MGSWVIARDMAKLNEENLNRLSNPGMFEKLKTRGSRSRNKVYQFKQATPEAIKAIQQKMHLENIATRNRSIVFAIVSLSIVMAIVIAISLIRF